MKNGKYFLVTGASGFVGSYLCSKLTEFGLEFRTLSFSQWIENSTNKNKADMFSADSLRDIGVIIHLAARVHVMNEKSLDPLSDFQQVNLHGTLDLARQAAAAGVKRFIFVSTIKVNGEKTQERPFSELDQPYPQDPYGISKWEAEQVLKTLSLETGMEIVIVRPPLVYGPGVKANFYDLLKIVSKRLPLPLNTIDNRRSMIYVGNLVDALVLCATHPKAANKTYLVSDGENISIPSLIKKLAFAMKRQPRLFSMPIAALRFFAMIIGKGKAVDRLTESLVIDSSNIRRELQWVPPYSLKDGLQATADWYISTLKSK